MADFADTERQQPDIASVSQASLLRRPGFPRTYKRRCRAVNVHYGECVTNTQALIDQAYSAFNRRDIDGALALMSENVNWPKASEGGRVVGKEEIRAYWTRQWTEFDPHVEPIEVTDREAGRTDVKVQQVVKNLAKDI